MKRKINLLIIMAIMPLCSLFAQTIPNPGFENWTSKYTAPSLNSWTNVNELGYFLTGKKSVAQSTDSRSGKYSAKIQAVAGKGQSIGGLIILGTIGKNGPTGGVAYASKPDSIKFSFKLNNMKGDTAQFILLFKNEKSTLTKGVVGGFDIKLGGNRTNWVDTTMKIFYYPASPTPDTVFAMIVAGNMTGSSVQVDNIQLIGSGTIAQLPNHDFEKWDSTGYEDADNWMGLNDLAVASGVSADAVKTTDAHTGSFAMQIKTEIANPFGQGNDTLGYVTTGSLGRGGLVGGFPYSNRPIKLSFYYKYNPTNSNDSANAGVWINYKGKKLDSSFVSLPASSSYTLYEMTIPYIGKNMPDTVNIAFASSNVAAKKHGGIAYIGSTFIVDDLLFTDYTGIEEQNSNISMLNIFPNPATNSLYLQCYKNDNEAIDFTINNTLGQVVFSKKMNIAANDNNPQKIQIGNLASGIYIYSVKNTFGTRTGKLVIE